MTIRPSPVKPGPGQESVWDYPRPPRLETFVGVDHRGTGRQDHRLDHPRMAGAGDQPPADVLPAPRCLLRRGVLRETSGSSWCEWKGQASYYDLVTETRVAPKAAWSYLNPSRRLPADRWRGRGDGRAG